MSLCLPRRLLCWCLLVLSIPAVALGDNDPEDPTTWTPIRIPGEQKMPEFDEIAEWINSPPLSPEELKGKVVVIHFLAFG